MLKLIHHLRHNAIAYLALFVALAGTSYGAFRVPDASVGERQLVNHSIDPVKLNPRFIGGYVRKWATVDASGRLIASGGKVKVSMPDYLPPATYLVDWRTHPTSRCEALASLDEHDSSSQALGSGSITSGTTQNSVRGVSTVVATFGGDGTSKAESFDIALLC